MTFGRKWTRLGEKLVMADTGIGERVIHNKAFLLGIRKNFQKLLDTEF